MRFYVIQKKYRYDLNERVNKSKESYREMIRIAEQKYKDNPEGFLIKLYKNDIFHPWILGGDLDKENISEYRKTMIYRYGIIKEKINKTFNGETLIIYLAKKGIRWV